MSESEAQLTSSVENNNPEKLTKPKNPKRVAEGKVLGAMSRSYKLKKAEMLKKEAEARAQLEMESLNDAVKTESEAEKALLSEETKSYNNLMLTFTILGVVISAVGLYLRRKSIYPFRKPEKPKTEDSENRNNATDKSKTESGTESRQTCSVEAKEVRPIRKYYSLD
jgi:hypothetical protein